MALESIENINLQGEEEVDEQSRLVAEIYRRDLDYI